MCKRYYGAKVIPGRGAWLEFETAINGAINVKINILVGVLRLKEKHLRNHKGSGNVVYLVGEKNDSVI